MFGVSVARTCSAQQVQPATPSDSPIKVGGLDVVTLTRKATQQGKKREFLSVTLFPGRGMNVFQVTAMIPVKGEVELLESPSVAEAASKMTGTGPDEFGRLSTSFGGAFFVPYGSRLFGKLSEDKKSVLTEWHGHTLPLPPNYQGKISGTGLIRQAQVGELHTQKTSDGEIETGVIHAGNFGGHWISDTDVHFKITLSRDAVDVSVTALNVGKEAEPMGLGWHPYVAIRSGDRSQARLHLPAAEYAVMDSNQVVSGELKPVTGSPYDFSAPEGAPLGDTFFENFTKLNWSGGSADAWVNDPKMNYCLHVRVLSPEVKAFAAWAPADRPFVAIEPQFNLMDPWGKMWHGVDTGFVTLNPGQSVAFKARLELSAPVTTEK
jgi:galactose mutarotase-like enzyme